MSGYPHNQLFVGSVLPYDSDARADASTSNTRHSTVDSTESTGVDSLSLAEPDPRRKYVCDHPGCTKSFTTTGHLARHIRTHTGERNFVCTYPGCTSRFSRHDNMLQHYRGHISKTPRRKRGPAKGSSGSSRKSTVYNKSSEEPTPSASPPTAAVPPLPIFRPQFQSEPPSQQPFERRSHGTLHQPHSYSDYTTAQNVPALHIQLPTGPPLASPSLYEERPLSAFAALPEGNDYFAMAQPILPTLPHRHSYPNLADHSARDAFEIPDEHSTDPSDISQGSPFSPQIAEFVNSSFVSLEPSVVIGSSRSPYQQMPPAPPPLPPGFLSQPSSPSLMPMRAFHSHQTATYVPVPNPSPGQRHAFPGISMGGSLRLAHTDLPSPSITTIEQDWTPIADPQAGNPNQYFQGQIFTHESRDLHGGMVLPEHRMRFSPHSMLISASDPMLDEHQHHPPR